MEKTLLVLLLILTVLPAVHSRRPKVLHIRAGEMVVLHCPLRNDAGLTWTIQTNQEMNLADSTSASGDRSQVGVLIHGRSLIILRATANHQGNFSCSLGNASSQFWFQLRVYPTKSREYEEKSQYPTRCYTQESCTLFCPTANIPAQDTPNITRRGTTWYKEGEVLPTHNHFSSVEETDGGVYTCIRAYSYEGQIYNSSFVVVLDVQPSKRYGQSAILSPQQNDVFPVDLGSTVVIDCKAVVYSDFDDVFWLSEASFVEINDSLPVFYNYSRTKHADEETDMTASLVFRQVSEEDMLRNYTCKLESDHQLSTFMTITLTKKARPVSRFPSLHLVFCLVSILMVMTVLTAVIIKRFKISIPVLVGKTFGCHDSSLSSMGVDPGSYLSYKMAQMENQQNC